MALHLETRVTALWTFLSTTVIVAVLAVVLGGFHLFFQQLFAPPSDEPGNPLAVGLMTVLFAGVCSFMATLVNLPATFVRIKHNLGFLYFFGLPALEEIVARWLCVGVLPQHLPPWTFCLCLLGGNALWVWYSDRRFYNMKSPVSLLIPKFIAGLFYAFIFLNYGLLAAYLVHLGTDSLLLCLHKLEDPERSDRDGYMMGLSFIYIGLAFAYLVVWDQKSLGEILTWLGKDVMPVEDWSFWDYLASSVCFVYFVKTITFFCGYDQGCMKASGKAHDLPVPIEVLMGCIALAITVFVGSLLLYIVIPSIHLRSVLASLGVCALYYPNSGMPV